MTFHGSYTEAGIIPAYAGNTLSISRRRRLRRDHPRVCGEHISDEENTYKIEGSSPRMRGTPWGGEIGLHIDGIIPAYAGNTSQGKTIPLRTRDHPRVCGEHAQ